MTSLVTPIVRPGSVLARRNPAAKLATASVLMLGLLVTTDIVTPGLVLAVEVAALVPMGVPLVSLAKRIWPVLVGLPGIALANAIFTDTATGTVLVDAGPLLITSDAAVGGFAAALRLFAIALPGVLVAVSTDPVDLADSLVQQLRLPARFTYGALSALRLVPLLGLEWQALRRARRARGLEAGRNPLAAVRVLGSQILGLLVSSLRRATRLATAMDARGFTASAPRTMARVQRVTAADWLLVVAAAALVVVATTISAVLGVWTFVLR